MTSFSDCFLYLNLYQVHFFLMPDTEPELPAYMSRFSLNTPIFPSGRRAQRSALCRKGTCKSGGNLYRIRTCSAKATARRYMMVVVRSSLFSAFAVVGDVHHYLMCSESMPNSGRHCRQRCESVQASYTSCQGSHWMLRRKVHMSFLREK